MASFVSLNGIRDSVACWLVSSVSLPMSFLDGFFGFDALSANFNVATLVCSYFRFVIVLQSPGSSLLILLLSPFRELNVPR